LFKTAAAGILPAVAPLRDTGRRAADFLGLNASMIAMIVLVVFLGLGEKMAERFLPLYLVALGGSTIAVGSLNAMDNLLSALYSFPGGCRTGSATSGR
jgi:hypothetical protein